MIWGILIVLLGLAILLKAIFHVDLPLFRIAFGLLLLYLGAQLILGWPHWHWTANTEGSTAVFAHREIVLGPGAQPERNYTVVFGRTVLDLRNLSLAEQDADVEVNAVFGGITVRVSPATPLDVDANVAFGGAELPDHAQVALGRYTYHAEGSPGAPPHRLRLRANVAFGSFVLQRE